MSVIQDNIGLGIKIHQTADKALSSMKSMIENAEGQLRGALQSTGQNSKAISMFAFTSATDTFQDATNLDKTRMGATDTFAIQLTTTNTATGAITNVGAAVAISTAGTVQNVIDSINNNTTLNPAGTSQRIRAYLNDINQLVVESAGGEDPTAVVGFQLNANLSGGVQSAMSEVWTYTGAGGKAVTYTGNATVAQTATAETGINQTRKAVASSFRELMLQLTNTAADAGYNGTNLLNGDSLRVAFNEDDTTSILTRGVRFNSTGLGFSTDNFTTSVGDSRWGFHPTMKSSGL